MYNTEGALTVKELHTIMSDTIRDGHPDAPVVLIGIDGQSVPIISSLGILPQDIDGIDAVHLKPPRQVLAEALFGWLP